jgi:hypothetical protein
MATPTVKELMSDYERCGSFLRRKDASVKNPSPIFTFDDVLKIASEEIAKAENVIRQSRLTTPEDH